jgi:hypothetical protein
VDLFLPDMLAALVARHRALDRGVPISKVASILIDSGIRRDHRHSAEIESLAAAIRDAVGDHAVQVKYVEPPPATDQIYSQDAFARVSPEIINLMVNVPWEAFAGAAATVFLESVRDWLGDRYESRYAERQAQAVQATKPSTPKRRLFGRRQELPGPVAKPITIIPHQVEIFGPRGELIGLVYQDASLSHPKIIIGPAAVAQVQHQRRRSGGWW